jgi:hypothetical protein
MSLTFSFLGHVKDRLLYCISDIKEHYVLSIIDWILKECDLNKDIELNDKTQLTLSDIQLKHAGRVLRLYVKSLQDKAVCRAEETLRLDFLLPEALDNIRRPHKSSEIKLNKILELIKQEDILVDTAKKIL